uniref:ADP-ribosylation factor-like protein 2-binding protein n=1 Tax=Nyctereutes procyonoides TaxID=34880 RepID=UPI002443F7DF|nr:ADP-ribosylation factor-like protein 2-binding protein [Nyctereutes procyonoides]
MEAAEVLGKESFSSSISSISEGQFGAVVGSTQDVVMDAEFQVLLRNLMDRYYQEVENELTYTLACNEYLSLVEKYIEEQLLAWIPKFNKAASIATAQHREDEVANDLFNMLFTFTDFLAFRCFWTIEQKKKAKGWP